MSMKITHNEINRAIEAMKAIVAKGQPFAKRNKDRRIRGVLRDMEIAQLQVITLQEIWIYVKMWLKGRFISGLINH